MKRTVVLALALALVLAVVLPSAALADKPGPNMLLWDNGPLVNYPGGGPGGADGSIALDVTYGLVSRGFNCSAGGAFRVADDFTVPAGGRQIDWIVIPIYQGGATGTTSPFTAVTLQIWNGPPDNPASTVVWGDPTTNRLASTVWSGAYRFLESDPTDTTRPVAYNTVTVNTFLAAGTYWIDYNADGDINLTGPWAPVVSIQGIPPLGNALQHVSGAWQPIVDSGLTTQTHDLPFRVFGPDYTSVDLTSIEAAPASPDYTVLLAAAVIACALAGAVLLRRAVAKS